MTRPPPLFALLLLAACGTSGSDLASLAICSETVNGCACDAEPESSVSPDAAAATLATCSAAAFPGTTCCAYSGWPGAGSCVCEASGVYCGVIADAFTNGESGCVCTTAPSSSTQVVGATCYPGGTTTATAAGVCCLDGNQCSCGGGAHTCAAGTTTVATCSAANVTAAGSACTGGTRVVASCTGG